nr:lipase family protein [Ornithinimicrobium sp. F0845]
MLLVLGVVAVVVGVLLATRPLTSLSALTLTLGAAFVVTGAVALLTDREERTRWDVARGVGWLVLGLLVLVWLRTSFDLLALAVGVVLVVSGASRIWTAVRGAPLGGTADTSVTALQTSPGRVASGLLGAAEIVIGVLAVRWPDLTLLAVAVVFAVRLVMLGIRLVRRATTRPAVARPADRTTYSPASGTGPGRARPWLQLVGGALALVLALGAAFLGVQARSGAPAVDAFYATPDEVPDEPGVLLRSEPFTRDVPEGATGWRILYTTTAADGAPATASAIVLVPEGVGAGPPPVIAWAHGTTGFATQCAPSLLQHPFEAGAMPALEQVVDRGWALVATDYTGLGTPGPHPYLIGPGEAHSVLDGIRAAQQFSEVDLSPDTVVWGHSQGGHAALWTGQLAADYAPELTLRGVVAMAPAADVVALAESLPGSSVGGLFASYVIAAYAAHYPEITLDEQVIAPARTLVREMSTRCLAEPSILASVVSVFSLARDRSVYARPPAEGALGERLRENVPTGPFPMPVLLAQGEADDLILPTDQRQYVDRLCSAGQSLAYRTYPGRDHLSLVEPESELIEDLLEWTADRFEGNPVTGGCG